MGQEPITSDTPPANNVSGRQLLLLSLAALGVVYGDIGTSCLYSVRECFHGTHAIPADPVNVLGVVSLILWVLILIISVKYFVFILRADNRGEGGILALAALVTQVKASARAKPGFVLILGLFGAALLYADGIITPAISVLSAVEGLDVAAPDFFNRYVEPITIAILIGLFWFQSRGTADVGSVFGPILAIWFVVIAIIGAWNVFNDLSILRAINPWYAYEFFRHNGRHVFVTLGTVFLAVTGGEALYADIGHFGRRPIRRTWFSLVLPSLLLNYLGQGAYLLSHSANPSHPFYDMAPSWAIYPLVVLATSAAVIASQAVITGAFSLTLQSIQLGYSPRMTIRHTSADQSGQIYIPAVNWTLMLLCIGLVLSFHSSGNLAAAYGVAITMTMVITTILFYVLVRRHWGWSLPKALLICGGFFVIDVSFLGANLTKIGYGGWFPLAVGGIIFLLMSTWRQGRQIVVTRLRMQLIPLDMFVAELLSHMPTRVSGTAVFMSGNPVGTPPALRHNVMHNKVLHENVVILSVETAETPHIDSQERVTIEEIGEGFWTIVLKYGFMEEPDVPQALAAIRHPKLSFAPNEISYFLGRETLRSTAKPGMARWRERLFVLMARNAQTATAFFNLPPERVIELGTQVEL